LEESRVSEAQKAVFVALEQLSQGDPEWVVRYAAIVGLEGLGTAAVAFRRAIRELLGQIRETEAEIVVKLRADQALEHLQ
jgi:phycocyanobilin lyase beta subunit